MMSLNHSLSWLPDLEEALDRHPIIVPPTTPLIEVITLMYQVHRSICSTGHDPFEPRLTRCVLVMQDQALLGILTERDIVRLIADTIDFTKVTVAEVMAQPVITLPQRSVQDIFAALFLFRRYQIRHLPIMDEQEQLIGVISHENIRQILRPANLLRFRRVSDVMVTPVIQAPLTAPIFHLVELMAEYRVSCVVITQPNLGGYVSPVGIVTERDIVQMQALQIDFLNTQAQTVMSTPLFLLNPNDSLWTTHQEMQKRRVGRLVVSWNWGQGLGIVTQTNLLRIFDPIELYGIFENLQQTIQQFEGEQSRFQASSESGTLPENHISLLCLIQSASNRIQQLLASTLDLSVEQQRSQLQSILEILEQLTFELKER
jgi:CBS domain-containing protein